MNFKERTGFVKGRVPKQKNYVLDDIINDLHHFARKGRLPYLNKKESKKAVDFIIDAIIKKIRSGNTVKIRNLGSFVTRAVKTGRRNEGKDGYAVRVKLKLSKKFVLNEEVFHKKIEIYKQEVEIRKKSLKGNPFKKEKNYGNETDKRHTAGGIE